MFRIVVWYKLTDVSEVLTASIIRACNLTQLSIMSSSGLCYSISCVEISSSVPDKIV
jgi:hypothetical protein